MSKPALGRGLSALLGGKPPGSTAPVPRPTPAEGPSAAPPRPETAPAPAPPPSAPPPEAGVRRVPVGTVRPSALQPRRDFPATSLQELADSIREQGILQPLVVRPRDGFLELIAGERRWRAAQLAGLAEVPVVLREADDATVLELMLVENLQREDLNPMDEAQGYAELLARFALTQEAVATRVGRSRTAVANALRLLRLPPVVQAQLRDGRLSTGHAKVILGVDSPELQAKAAERVVTEGLSVRQTEEWVTRLAAPAPAPEPGTPARAPAVTVRDPHVVALEDRLRQRLGTKVALRYRQGRGQIDIRFYSDDELERVLALVGVPPE
jgi:ParB family chromosome partitioning protein